jgi:Undecaprenyl-phosphate galactose phosphotransferase WbaP
MSTAAIAPVKPINDPNPARTQPLALYLFLIDVLGVELALILGQSFRFGWASVLRPSILASYSALMIGVLVLPIVYASLGLYPGYGLGAVQRLKTRVYSSMLVFGSLFIWNLAWHSGSWSRAVLVLTMICSLIVLPSFETLGRWALSELGTWGSAVVVIGANKASETIIAKLQRDKSLGLMPIALLDDDPTTWGSFINEVPVCGPLSMSGDFRRKARIVIVPSAGVEKQRLLSLIEGLAFPTVLLVPDLVGLQSLWTVSRDLGGILGLELRKNLLVPVNRGLKRALDCLVAIPALVIAIPIIAIAAVWIKLINPGPAFFKQKREGENGKTIEIWKLRTMFINADDLLKSHLSQNPEAEILWKQHYKLRHDPRVLPLAGSLLRRLSIDELPQLWNVLKGEMSLVGPRPFPYYHLEGFSESFRMLRRSVMPGLTGLWQVSERSDGDLHVQEAQDTYYIRNWSLWFDIYLLIKTAGRVLFPKGAY